MIDQSIKSTFGIDCKIEKTKIKGLALYMTARREFYMVTMEGFSFLLVKVQSDDRFGAIALEKQASKIKETVNYEVAFGFDKLTKLQRTALIERHIPFISDADQIYLPFLGIALRNNLKEKVEVSKEKMMPATQALFLYLLYNCHQEYVLKKQAAEELRLTRTSITRASEQLKAMGLITEEVCGKELRMRTTATGFELYQAAKPYIITPVQKKIYVKKVDIGDDFLLAGESALSNVSMLGEPRYATYAIYKGNELVKNLKPVDIQWQENEAVIQIELWKYDPSLFAKNGIVDPVSMAVSLADNVDERVQGELQSCLEDYKW